VASPRDRVVDPARWAGAILLAAALIRFFRLDLFSLGFDEAMSLKRATEPSLGAVWRATFVEVPVYNSLLHGWILLGRNPATARSLSAGLSVLALWAGWRILKGILGPAPALAALALFAFSPFQVQYAQEARPYMLTLLAEFVAVLALFRAADRGCTADWGIWAAACALAALSHLVALAWIAASAAYVWLAGGGKSRRRNLLSVAGWGALAAAPAVVFAVAAARSIAHVNAVAARSYPLADFGMGIVNFFGPGAWIPAPAILPSLAVFGLLMVAGVCLCAMPVRRDPGLLRLRGAVLAFGLVPLALVLAGNWTGAVYRPKLRYAMGSQLFLLAACARAIWAVRGRWMRAATLVLLLALDAASLGKYFGGGFPTLDLPPCKKPFRETAEWLVSRARPGDGILSYGFETYLPLDWYLAGRLAHGYALRDPLVADEELRLLGKPIDIRAFALAHRRVWFVVAPVTYEAPLEVPGDALAALRGVASLRDDSVRPGIRVQCWVARR